MDSLKLIHFGTIALLLLLFGINFVFCNETNGRNKPKTWTSEEPAKITVVGGMHVEPEHPEPGDEFALSFRIKNNSTVMAEDLNVTIQLPFQLELVSGSKKIQLGNVGPNQERVVSWKIRANASADYIIDLDFETANLGISQSKWLLEIYPRFTSFFFDPWVQLLVIIVLLAVIGLVFMLARKSFQRSRHFRAKSLWMPTSNYSRQ